MNWILALLAFAGLMTILSTIVYIIVEALHKGLSLRRSGLAEMLRALHDNVVVGLEQGTNTFVSNDTPKGGSSVASDFADAMQQSPSYAGTNRWWWPSNWGLNLNQRKFERMSRLQLAEQLAQTEYGQKLARSSRSDIEFAMSRLGHEFDRFGEAQSAYFKRRAKVMSGLVGFAFVILANINVIDIYIHLASNEQALNKTLAVVSADNPQELALLQKNLQSASAQLTNSLEQDGVTSEEAIAAAKDVQIYLNNLQGGLDLPIGRNYFPYCSSPLVDSKRCSADVGDSIKLFFLYDVKAPKPVVRLVSHWQTGLYWIFCMIASAGLLALGAPFWFDLFSKTATLVGSLATNRIASVGAPKASELPPTDGTQPFARSSNPDPSQMADALIIAAGVPKSELALQDILGMKLGSSSSQAVKSDTSELPSADEGDAMEHASPGDQNTWSAG